MTKQEYTFNNNIFNPLYFKLREASTRFVVSYGGGGSGKSYTQAQHEVIKALERKEKILVIRKVGATLKDSVIPQIEAVMSDWGNIPRDFVLNKSDRIMTNKVNGSQIIFRGMDDPEKIKSIQGVTRVWYEEVTEGDEMDIDQLNVRLRGSDNLQITVTFNPIDELHWIKKKFFDTYRDDTTIIHTTYKDNVFIDPAFIEQIERYRLLDKNFYEVYGLGNWGKLTKGGEFYKQFKIEKHALREIEYNNTIPLHITFDENVNPYLTLNVWQVEEKNARQVDEIMLPDPDNTLSATLREFMRRYPPNGTTIYVYGDATSRKADTKLEKGVNFYSLIQKFLIDNSYNYEIRVPGQNPSVDVRGNFIDAIFAEQYDGIELYISGKCKNTINDYQYTKKASDGGKFKEMARNPNTKVNYQKWGHATDANDYFICYFFEESFRKYQAPDSNGLYRIGGRRKRESY